MYSLLIDTHDKLVSYVLYNDGKVVDQVQLESNMRHSEIAMPSLIEILKKNNLEIKDIKEILVVIGPGSFTGVRIGVVIAKTTAYLLNIPIKPMKLALVPNIVKNIIIADNDNILNTLIFLINDDNVKPNKAIKISPYSLAELNHAIVPSLKQFMCDP